MEHRDTVVFSGQKGQTLPEHHILLVLRDDDGNIDQRPQDAQPNHSGMTFVNTGRIMAAIIPAHRVSIYSPIVEAVVNSLEAIEDSGRKDGRVVITLHRDKQQKLVESSREIAPVVQIDVQDNGVGFTDENLKAFDTFGTEQKIARGGKGFGRLVFLHFFDDVRIKSFYKQDGGHFRREFKFVREEQIIKDREDEKLKKEEFDNLETTVSLSGLKEKYIQALNKNLDTISRRLLERLLVYFVLEDYKCPEIVVRDAKSNESITLNTFLEEKNEIAQIHETKFDVRGGTNAKESFSLKLFKIYFTESKSTINLVANQRLVTDERLGEYVMEFQDDFSDSVHTKGEEKKERRFVVKAYVQGAYLDSNVSVDRGGFNFGKGSNAFFQIGRFHIEEAAAKEIKEYFGEEVATRQKGKEKRFKSYVNEKAPWHKGYLDEVDLSDAPYGLNDEGMEKFLQGYKIEQEAAIRTEAKNLLSKSSEDPKKILKEAVALVENAGKIGTSDLAHYVATRKVILDLFRKSLEWDDKHKYQKEKIVHEIIFPKGDSSSTEYEEQNLWLLDERLSFYEYVASDQPLSSEEPMRPDIFGRPVLVRGRGDPGDAIVVFEFKKPQKETYKEEENPIKQISGYVEKIRAGKATTKSGRPIQANENTPAFGFVVCDLTPKIREYCRDATLKPSPDNMGYFGYHSEWGVYFEVMSYDQLLDRAEMRNKIFFKKLGL